MKSVGEDSIDIKKSEENICQVCNIECKPLRCTRCRQAWYCSQVCQKIGWKAGHRASCGNSTTTGDKKEQMPQQAMMELQSLMTKNHTLDTLSAEYHKAKDEMERISSEPCVKPEVHERKIPAPNNTSSPIKASKAPYKAPPIIPAKKVSKQECGDLSRIAISKDSYWEFWVENLININSYQIMLRPKPSQLQSISSLSAFVNQLEMSVTVREDRQSSVVSLRRSGKQPDGSTHHPILYILLPGKVNPAPSAFEIRKEGTGDDKESSENLSLRLQYEASIDQQHGYDDLGDSSLLSTELDETSANHLHCKFCRSAILQEAAKIDRVVRMPSSNWDDIADYLICYSGQATIDFTSASTNAAQSGAVLVDSNAVLLHQDDVGGSVCVLAVEGYGEESIDAMSTAEEPGNPTSPFATAAAEMGNDAPAVVRGPRSWRETVGGGSICCSQCCSILGYASLTSPETYRFLKHRLVTEVELTTSDASEIAVIESSQAKVPRYVPLTPCARFVAHEMIRYAETKAIFTFVVERNETNAHGKLLLLKLLSWDSQFASSDTAMYLENSQESHLIQDAFFQKSAKIIFEETWLDVDTTSSNANEMEDISSWIWGGADLCCLPDSAGGTSTAASGSANNKTHNTSDSTSSSNETTPGSQAQSESSVRLLLETNEWDELRDSLQKGAQLFSKEVVDATVAAKLGSRNTPHRGNNKITTHGISLGLSVISLNSK